MELFFLNYALDALHEAGEPEMADRLVRACYGPMRDRGAPTFWETLSEGSLGGGSQCHAWSGAATHACITRILGLRPAKPGRTDKYVVAPRCAGLSRAGGVFPHPKGEIRVDWTRDGDGLRVTASAPEGVELIVESEVAGEPAGGLPRS